VITFKEVLQGDSGNETGNFTIPQLESITKDTIIFRTPANSEVKEEFVNVTVDIAGLTHEFPFGYDLASSPLITSISPEVVSSVEPTLLTITGHRLGTRASDVEITLGGDRCVVRTITDTNVQCMWFPMGSSQLVNCDVKCERLDDGVKRTEHEIVYNIKDKGIAIGYGEALNSTSDPPYILDPPGALSVRVALEINSVVPDRGSIFGGTILTIRGAGFGVGEMFPTSVSIGNDYPASVCDVISGNLTYIVCATRIANPGDEDAYQNVEASVRNVPTECKPIPYPAQTPNSSSLPPASQSFNSPPPIGSSAGNCNFLYSSEYTPIVTEASPSPVTSSSVLVITGNYLSASTNVSSVTVHFVKVATIDSEPFPLIYESQVCSNCAFMCYGHYC
jgi:hypothetical protein